MNKSARPLLPFGIDADLAIAIVSAGVEAYHKSSRLPMQFTYEFKGVHERTAVGDELQITLRGRQKKSNLVKYTLKRDSLYHILPEYLFHPLDRYAGCDQDEDEFLKCYKQQEEMTENALAYFYPYDKVFQELRTDFQHYLNDHILTDNLFIADFITAGFQVNLANKFIRSVYPCLLWLRQYRGYENAIRTALKFAFANQVRAYHADWVTEQTALSAHCHYHLEGTLDELFCGDTFSDSVYRFDIQYQIEIHTKEQIARLTLEIEEFQRFFQDWFLNVEQHLHLVFGDWTKVPIIESHPNGPGLFLNYNTQLIH